MGMVSTYKDWMESTSLIYRIYRVLSAFKDRMESTSSIYKIYRVVSTFKVKMESTSSIYRIYRDGFYLQRQDGEYFFDIQNI